MFPVYMGIAEVWDEYGYWSSSFFAFVSVYFTREKKKKDVVNIPYQYQQPP